MVSTPTRPLAWKMPAAAISIDMLTSPAIVIAMITSIRSKRKIFEPLAVAAPDHAPLGQRRVQVDHVRHHGRAQDAGGQNDALGARESRHEQPVGDRAGIGMGVQHLEREPGHDDADQAHDRGLEMAKATPRLQRQQRRTQTRR